ncbi:Imm1 family immunity protein [Saccharothrix lopnurensis]|uniref:Imm1 family immunity protein n=1 Tax=Saccharothrix lopnurensis TaxID=1670621 RepID=A0ABW1PCB7_9PSEU
MTVQVRWTDLEPGTIRHAEVHEVVLTARSDVEELVARLARPDTSEALLVHSARPLKTSSLTGGSAPDHRVVVAVGSSGFGYVEYLGPGGVDQLVGDPGSPEWHTTTGGHFPAGAGVDLATLVEVVEEFRVTAARPASVGWRDALGD